MIRSFVLPVVCALLFHPGSISVLRAESPVSNETEVVRYLTAAEMDLVVGPIALFPDPLIAVILPAATVPTEIVMAARFLNAGGDADRAGSKPWSESVKILLYFPGVLRWMDDRLEWSTQLGNAFLTQPEDVMEAIQRLRSLAASLGNLRTTTQQLVESCDDLIDILPVNPYEVFVPVYDPWVAYRRQSAYGDEPCITFDPGIRVGSWFCHDWDWRERRVVMWSDDYCRPQGWWSQSRADRFRAAEHVREWCPKPRAGQTPARWWAKRSAQQAARAAAEGQKTQRNVSGSALTGGATTKAKSPSPSPAPRSTPTRSPAAAAATKK